MHTRNNTEHRDQTYEAGFTLIELLVCIAVIAVLASILLPVLGRAKYKAQVVMCTNNLKQAGTGLIVYATDYDTWYPYDHCDCTTNKACYDPTKLWKSLQARGSKLTVMRQKPHHNTAALLEPYVGGVQGMKKVEMCPLVEQGFRQKWPDLENTSLSHVPYAFYFAAFVTGSGHHVIEEPMLKTGKRWRQKTSTGFNGTAGMYSNVLASDRIKRGSDSTMTGGNHYPLNGSPYTFYVRSDGRDRQWDFYGAGSANYLLDDGSVHNHRNLVGGSTDMGGAHSMYMPLDYYYDQP